MQALVIETPGPRSRRTEAAFSVIALLVYFAVVLVCQRVSDASGAGFGSYPDEASHYITGLMVHDYLRAGFPGSPVAYARQFYLHLPLIGIGHWPPLFYFVEGAWMLVAGTSRNSVLVLMAAITALLAFETYRLSRPYTGRWGASLVGLWLLAVPVMRWSDDLVMLDVFAALLILWAAVQFGRFLDTGSSWDSVWFGALAALAFLAKPAALCLLFVPVLAILITGRYKLLWKASLWYAVPVVAVLVVPWYWYTLPLAFYGHNTLTFRQQVAENFPLFFRQVWGETNFLAAFGLVGLSLWIWRARKQFSGIEASLLALPAAVLVSILVAHVDLEPRYVIPAIAPLLVAAAAGVAAFAGRVFPRWHSRICLAGLLVATTAFAGMSYLPARLTNAPGVSALASRALSFAPATGTTMLVVAPTAAREGRIMAEVAMLSSDRTRNVVVRGTKLLADVDWNATTYRPYCQTPEQMLQMLDRSGIDLFLVDATGKIPSVWSHYDFAMSLPGLYPARFEELGAYPNSSAPVYRLYRMLPALRPIPRPDLMLEKLNEKFGASSQ